MKILTVLLVAGGLMGGWVTQGAVAQGLAPADVYRGEVWTWDPTLNVVTLVQGEQKLRLAVTPDQLVGLRKGDVVTVRGTPAPPVDIQHVIGQAPPMRPVPTGPMDQAEIAGTITAVGPSGTVSVATSRGPIVAWVATPVDDHFRLGEPVRVKATLQAVDMVPIVGSSTSEPAALAASEPGDYSVVTGRILGLEGTGQVTIESPRGPITTWVADSSHYRVGQAVQLRTFVVAGQ